jgi:NAD(P)H dehydrogenase (quinone)
MTTILVTTANGETGRPMVDHLLKEDFRVRAMVRGDDERAQRLRDRGVEVVFGDLLHLRDVRAALKGVQRAYFSYPVGEGLVEAAVMFAQAAKEQSLEYIVNISHYQSRPDARSKSTQNHWLAEQIFTWAGVPTTHMRVSVFTQWLLYISGLIRYGRYAMPFAPHSRFAPITASDVALIATKLFTRPAEHAGQALSVTGAIEYSHEELAAEVSRVLGRALPYEEVTVATFLELMGIPDDTAKLKHFEAFTIDQREGRLAGVTGTAAHITGQPLQTVEDFISERRSLFELPYVTPPHS